MPSKPLEQEPESHDGKIHRMQALYGDFMRDQRIQHRHDLFPLDIRRVYRASDESYRPKVGTPLLESGETLVRSSWHNPERKHDDLTESDPWWITKDQAQHRDVPPRRYPPVHGPMGEDLLPIDPTIWLEEVENDDHYRARYFVTNLHGGTLIINGMEVKKG